ncbi:hypothetical protein C8R43DRAFT_957905 [Mycena crocata]|nr:hypothetical protein C8R43DRAFT_957905 [Mycena crocata]
MVATYHGSGYRKPSKMTREKKTRHNTLIFHPHNWKSVTDKSALRHHPPRSLTVPPMAPGQKVKRPVTESLDFTKLRRSTRGVLTSHEQDPPEKDPSESSEDDNPSGRSRRAAKTKAKKAHVWRGAAPTGNAPRSQDQSDSRMRAASSAKESSKQKKRQIEAGTGTVVESCTANNVKSALPVSMTQSQFRYTDQSDQNRLAILRHVSAHILRYRRDSMPVTRPASSEREIKMEDPLFEDETRVPSTSIPETPRKRVRSDSPDATSGVPGHVKGEANPGSIFLPMTPHTHGDYENLRLLLIEEKRINKGLRAQNEDILDDLRKTRREFRMLRSKMNYIGNLLQEEAARRGHGGDSSASENESEGDGHELQSETE